MSKDGLCAVITGSASGLGAATAAILAKGGARLVINYASSQKEAEHHEPARAKTCDQSACEIPGRLRTRYAQRRAPARM